MLTLNLNVARETVKSVLKREKKERSRVCELEMELRCQKQAIFQRLQAAKAILVNCYNPVEPKPWKIMVEEVLAMTEDQFIITEDGEIIFHDPEVQDEYELRNEPCEGSRMVDFPDEKLHW